MKGCLSLVFKAVVLILVFFGLLHLGVIDWIQEKINNQTSQEAMIDKTKDVIDFSNIDEEYTIQKNLNLVKSRMIFAEHNATGQRFIMLQPKNDSILTKDDIESEELQDKINKALSEKQQVIKIDDILITQRGEMQGIGQTIPYAKAELKISGLPIKDQQGIIAVATTKAGKDLLIIAVNEKGKYSQIITDSFFSKVE